MLKKPDRISLLILLVITVLAVIYGLLTWRENPENVSFPVADDVQIPYEFRLPEVVYDLPSDLDEISGLAYWSNEQLFTVQDEEGKVFVYDMVRKAVIHEMDFAKDRDYEGIARIDSTIYVLERDGDIHYFDYKEGEDDYDAKKHESSFSYRNDTEGITYDPLKGQLIVVPKEEQLVTNVDQSHLKGLYYIDADSGEVTEEPFCTIDQYRLGEIIFGKRQRYLMKPSAVAVHPETNHIYLLASVGKLLVVLDRECKIVHLERLDERLFSQPEGITFTPRGELLISSEGRNGRPIIARFSPEPTTEQ